MMKDCLDEGVLQAFLDNELAPERSQKVAMHIADCESCAVLLADIEEETAVAFSALESEFNTLVPTQRLWSKINESIETERKSRTIWQNILSFGFQISGFKLNFANLSAMASLLFVFAVFGVMFALKPSKNNDVAVSVPNGQPTVATTVTETNPQPIPANVPAEFDKKESETKPQKADIPQFRVETANFVKTESNRKPKKETPQPKNDTVNQIPQYIEGEENYVRTIARLERTVDDSKDAVLSPSAQVSFEKDLAIVNDSIDRMRKQVKQNPKNESAKQILFASYQNKIDLLNSVNERGALMASLR